MCKTPLQQNKEPLYKWLATWSRKLTRLEDKGRTCFTPTIATKEKYFINKITIFYRMTRWPQGDNNNGRRGAIKYQRRIQ
jgi:hypothetical protein